MAMAASPSNPAGRVCAAQQSRIGDQQGRHRLGLVQQSRYTVAPVAITPAGLSAAWATATSAAAAARDNTAGSVAIPRAAADAYLTQARTTAAT